MKYTADSWFFLQLMEGKEKAVDIWKDIRFGKSKLIVPTVVIAELTKRFLKFGYNKKLEKLLEDFESSSKIIIVDLNFNIAKGAGNIGNSYNIPVIDSIIIATAIKTEHINILTDDDHFIPAAKQKKINKTSF